MLAVGSISNSFSERSSKYLVHSSQYWHREAMHDKTHQWHHKLARMQQDVAIRGKIANR